MSRTDYKNEKMKLNALEKIGLKLFSTRQILSRKLASRDKICQVENSCVVQFIHFIASDFFSVSSYLSLGRQSPCRWALANKRRDSVSPP